MKMKDVRRDTFSGTSLKSTKSKLLSYKISMENRSDLLILKTFYFPHWPHSKERIKFLFALSSSQNPPELRYLSNKSQPRKAKRRKDDIRVFETRSRLVG